MDDRALLLLPRVRLLLLPAVGEAMGIVIIYGPIGGTMATMEEMLAWLGDRCHVLSLTKIGPDLWQCAAISTDGTRHAVGRDESAHRAVLDVFEDLGGPSRRDRK